MLTGFAGEGCLFVNVYWLHHCRSVVGVVFVDSFREDIYRFVCTLVGGFSPHFLLNGPVESFVNCSPLIGER